MIKINRILLGVFFILTPFYMLAESVWQPVFLRTSAMKAAGITGGECGQYQTCMERSLREPDIILTGIDVGGVVKSVNNGKNWFFPVMEGLRGGAVSSVAFSPETPEKMYAYGHYIVYKEGSKDGFFRSTDGGNKWQLTLDLTALVDKQKSKPRIHRAHHQIEIDTKSGTVYFGTWIFGLYKSKKGGDPGSWEKKGLEGLYIRHVKIDPFNGNNILVGTDEGDIWRSADAGDKWVKAELTLQKKARAAAGTAIGSLKFDPKVRDLVYAVVENEGLFRSPDGGRNFEKIENRPKTFGFELSPVDHDYMYLLTQDKDAYYSHDGGKEWRLSKINAELQFIRSGWIGNPSTGISPDPRDKNKGLISIGTRIYRTSDGGENWDPSSEGNPGFAYGWSAPSTNHYFDGDDPKRQWTFNLDFGTVATEDGWDTAACYGNGDTKWKDGTWSWGSCTYGGVIVKNKDKERWIVIGGKYFRNTIYISEDKGRNWHFVEDENKFPLELGYAEAILQHPDKQNIIYCCNLKSSDGGVTWKKMADGTYRVLGLFRKNGDIIYGARGERKNNRNIYKSKDQGATWEQLPEPPLKKAVQLGYHWHGTAEFAVDTKKEDVFYTVSSECNILKYSPEEGWKQLNIIQDCPCSGEVATHPKKSGVVFCCCKGEGEPGVFMSSDFGSTWKCLQADLPMGGKGSLVVDPHEDTLYFNGGFGMWKRKIPE